MIFEPKRLATSWLAVAVAASDDDERPQLYRTVCVEWHPTGVRLVSTDGVLLLHAWVPAVGHDFDPEPPWERDAFDDFDVAMDVHGRAAGLCRFLLKLAKADDEEEPLVKEARLAYGTRVVEGTPSFDGMAPRYVSLELPHHEQVTLEVYEGEFPDWAALYAKRKPRATSELAMAVADTDRLARVGRIVGCEAVRYRYASSTGAVSVDFVAPDLTVSGLVMPVRA